MKFRFVRAPGAATLRLDDDSSLPRDNSLTVILCPRGSTVATRPGTQTLWYPLFGRTRLVAGDWTVQLSRGDVCAGDTLARHEVTVSERGACIGIIGSTQTWAALGRRGPDGAPLPSLLFPAVHRRQRSLARRLLRFARACVHDDGGAGDNQRAHLLTDAIDQLQSGFGEMIARCPGTSFARKQAVFLRLQRVRSYITACAHRDLDVGSLALMANYSVGHFITTFRMVFDETPYSTISRHRLENASTLLSGSELGISDIAHSIGFQSRSSFNRAIKRHLGQSASAYRDTCREAAVR